MKIRIESDGTAANTHVIALNEKGESAGKLENLVKASWIIGGGNPLGLVTLTFSNVPMSMVGEGLFIQGEVQLDEYTKGMKIESITPPVVEKVKELAEQAKTPQAVLTPVISQADGNNVFKGFELSVDADKKVLINQQFLEELIQHYNQFISNNIQKA